MKRTSKRLISFILTLTLICTMLVGFGTIETFAAESVKLVKRNVHLDINDIEDWVAHNSYSKMPKVNDKKNASIHVGNAIPSTDTDGQEMLQLHGASSSSGNHYHIDMYYDKDTFSKAAESGIFEITGQMKADWDTGTGDEWVYFDENGAKIPLTGFRAEFAKTTANNWYDFVITFNLDDDYAYMKLTDTDDPTAEPLDVKYDKLTSKFKSLRMTPGGFTNNTRNIYMKKLNVSYYETKDASNNYFTKSVINEVGSDNLVAPGSSVSFTLDKAIEGLETNPGYVTVTAGATTLTAIQVSAGENNTYTATFATELAAQTAYTLNIDADCYTGYLEAGAAGYTAVTDISKAFDTTVANAQAYMTEMAETFTWDKVTDEPINSIDTAVELPTSYNGITVSWVADPADAIVDGKLKVLDAGTLNVTLTPTFTYGGQSLPLTPFEITLVKPLVYDGTHKFTFTNGALTRIGTSNGVNHSKNDQAEDGANGHYLVSQGNDLSKGGTWNSYFQVNFAGYEEILEDPTTKLTFSLKVGGPFGTTPCYDLHIYAMNDKVDGYTTTINGDDADKLGLHEIDSAAQQLVCERNETTGMGASSPTAHISYELTETGKQAIVNALKSGTDDSIVTFTVKSGGGASYYNEQNATYSFLKMDYASEKIDDQGYLDTIAESFNWNVISNDEQNAVKDDLRMDTFYRGATVAWTSTNTDAVGVDGTINPSKEAPKTTNLTATLTYKGLTAPAIEFNNVTVAIEQPKTETVNATYFYNVRSKSPDGLYGDSTSYGEHVIQSRGMNYPGTENDGNGDSLSFMQFDLSKAAKMIDAAQSITLTINNLKLNTGGLGSQGTSGVVTLLNDWSDNWNDTNLNYNYAVASGMYTDPGLYTKIDVVFGEEYVVLNDAALLTGIKTAIAQDPDEGKITFKFHAKDESQCKFKAYTRNTSIAITYYESDLKADEYYADKMTWSAISDQDINNVVAKLTLPATWYGMDVEWSTTDAAVVNTDGTVTIADTAKSATLTAKIGDKTVDFPITVPATGLVLRSDRIYTPDADAENDTTLNYTTGYIYANADMEGTYAAIVATYNDNNELVSVAVKENLTITAGKNIIPSGSYGEYANAKTKIILVNNMDELIPLAVAK